MRGCLAGGPAGIGFGALIFVADVGVAREGIGEDADLPVLLLDAGDATAPVAS